MSRLKTESRAGLIVSAAMNMLTAVMAVYGALINYGEEGLQSRVFMFYTVDSNLLAAAGCGVLAVFCVRRLVSGRQVPGWAVVFKYVGTCCLTVTFLVVALFLAPFYSRTSGSIGRAYYMMMAQGSMLFHHLLCPVTAFASLAAFDELPFGAGKCARIAVIPTALYAVVSTALNILKVWHGPYPFLYVYEQPWWLSFLWAAAIVGGAWAAALLTAKLAGRGKRSHGHTAV